MSTESQDQRRLAAIMFTDMVGYSAITQKDEMLALDLLEEHRIILRKIFVDFNGMEVETVGDQFFVEFTSALEAVECAVKIQESLHKRNKSKTEERGIILRIGVHIGDVVHRGNNVLGDGVNIAARLEPLCQPGGICISEDVARQIQNKIDYQLHKIGKKHLKNIQIPVEVFSLQLPWIEFKASAEPDEILHYKIIEKIGEGGMGIVYKAEDTKLNREVAIKFLSRRISSTAQQRDRFKTEARAAAALNHSNIATIYAIEDADDELFIVTEYIEGKELKKVLDNEELDIKKFLDISVQIADGLQAAHERDIIHRDVKSSNVMMNTKGKVKIMDFGLAKIADNVITTEEGTALGTISYMSPEQIKGESIDKRADIWGFGVIMYEMITKKLPFKGKNNAEVFIRSLQKE